MTTAAARPSSARGSPTGSLNGCQRPSSPSHAQPHQAIYCLFTWHTPSRLASSSYPMDSPDTQTGPLLISMISAVHKPNHPINQDPGSLTVSFGLRLSLLRSRTAGLCAIAAVRVVAVAESAPGPLRTSAGSRASSVRHAASSAHGDVGHRRPLGSSARQQSLLRVGDRDGRPWLACGVRFSGPQQPDHGSVTSVPAAGPADRIIRASPTRRSQTLRQLAKREVHRPTPSAAARLAPRVRTHSLDPDGATS